MRGLCEAALTDAGGDSENTINHMAKNLSANEAFVSEGKSYSSHISLMFVVVMCHQATYVSNSCIYHVDR